MLSRMNVGMRPTSEAPSLQIFPKETLHELLYKAPTAKILKDTQIIDGISLGQIGRGCAAPPPSI